MELRIKVIKSNISIYLLILVFFPPDILERMSDSVNNLQKFIQILLLIGLAFLLIIKGSIRFKKSHFYWMAFCAYGLILTAALQPEYVYNYLVKVVVPIFSVILLFLYFMIEETDIENLLGCMARHWMTLILLNALLMLIFPNGVIQSAASATHERANWLFGSKNNVVYPLIFGGSFIALYGATKRKWYYTFIIAIAAIEMVCSGEEGVALFGGSSTGLVGFAMFIILFYMQGIVIRLRIINKFTFFKIGIFFFFVSMFVIYGTLSSNSGLAALFAVLGKDATASGRANAWRVALTYFFESPLVGQGYSRTLFTATLTSTYNFFLDCILRYGLLGMTFFFATLKSYSIKAADVSKNMRCYVMTVAVACLFMCGIVNTIRWEFLTFLMEFYAMSAVAFPDKVSKGRGDENYG